MTIKFLAGLLTNDTLVIVKDYETHETYLEEYAKDLNFDDEVQDWDFSDEHIIYI